MARFLNSLLSRFVLGALAIQLLLAPLLFLGVTRVVEDSSIDLFVNDVGAYSRFLAELLEFEIASASDEELIDFLDSVMLSREAIYAELAGGSLQLRSRLVDDASPRYVEDFAFAEHEDDTYFLSIPLNNARDPDVVLRLGFDERDVLESVARTRMRTLWILSGFVGASLFLVAVFAFVLGKPLRDLQRASQTVASGNYNEHFDVSSRVTEILELARDLENMRGKLVTANRRLSAEVEERAKSERARAGLERRLQHAQRLETVGTLAGGIAHEFNNVLVPIKMYTELALDDVPPDGMLRKNLERVLAATGRAKNVVEKILKFSRQSPPERYGSVDVAAVVEDALELAKNVFPATIEVKADIDRDDARVFGDASEVHQLMVNLLNNASQAIGPTGGQISVRVARRSLSAAEIPASLNVTPGEHVVVAVADTGDGMDAATLERIFEPFFTTKGPGLGTGLGLSVAHGIVANHSGDIEVQSRRGSGTTFTVYLPVAGNPHARLAQLGIERVLCVATSGADPRFAALATAIGARITTVRDRDELIGAIASDGTVDLLIVDFGGGLQWADLDPAQLSASLEVLPRVLLVGSLGAAWEDVSRRWPHVFRWRGTPNPAILCELLEHADAKHIAVGEPR